jgi:hypothetical protein
MEKFGGIGSKFLDLIIFTILGRHCPGLTRRRNQAVPAVEAKDGWLTERLMPPACLCAWSPVWMDRPSAPPGPYWDLKISPQMLEFLACHQGLTLENSVPF